MILFLTPNPSLSLYFQTDKLIFGRVDVDWCPRVINLSIVHCSWFQEEKKTKERE